MVFVAVLVSWVLPRFGFGLCMTRLLRRVAIDLVFCLAYEEVEAACVCDSPSRSGVLLVAC